MPSSRRPPDARRKTFLNLSAQIEGQLREAYARKFQAGLVNQTSLANKLGVDRSAIHRRLMGHTNMTIETIADMVWALDHAIKIDIFDPSTVHGLNHWINSDQPKQVVQAPPQSKGIVTGSPPSIANIIDEILRNNTATPTPVVQP